MKNNQQYVNLTEASELFGLDRRTMKKIWLCTNELHFTRTGRQLLMNKAELVDFFKQQDNIKY